MSDVYLIILSDSSSGEETPIGIATESIFAVNFCEIHARQQATEDRYQSVYHHFELPFHFRFNKTTLEYEVTDSAHITANGTWLETLFSYRIVRHPLIDSLHVDVPRN